MTVSEQIFSVEIEKKKPICQSWSYDNHVYDTHSGRLSNRML